MNGWRESAWKQNSWGSSWGSVILTVVKRVKRIVLMPSKYIPFPLFKK